MSTNLKNKGKQLNWKLNGLIVIAMFIWDAEAKSDVKNNFLSYTQNKVCSSFESQSTSIKKNKNLSF